MEAEQWGINTKSPSPQHLGEAAPPLTQPMEGEGRGEDAMHALAVVACHASAAALASKDDCPQKMDPPENVNAGVAYAFKAAAMSHTLVKPQVVWDATTEDVFPPPPPTGEFA